MVYKKSVTRDYRIYTTKKVPSILKIIFFSSIIFSLVLPCSSFGSAGSIHTQTLIQPADNMDQTIDNGAGNDPSSLNGNSELAFSWNPNPPLIGEPTAFTAKCSNNFESCSTSSNLPDGGISFFSSTESFRKISLCDNNNDNKVIDGNQKDEPGDITKDIDVRDERSTSGTSLNPSFSWNFGDGTSSEAEEPMHVYTTARDYSVSLTVVDIEGRNSIATHTVHVVSSRVPLAVIDEISPSPGIKGESVSFKGHGKDPAEDSIVNYSWRSNINGNLSTKQSFSTANLFPGTHTISFKVENYSGFWSAEVQTTLLIDIPPVADAGETLYFGWIQEPICFDGSQSHDTDGFVVNYTWDFGDGTVATGKSITHTYSRIGTFAVTLTVTDNNGGSSTVSTIAQITCDPPIANTGGPYYGYIYQPICFNGSKSSDSSGNIIEYIWDFGDNTTGTGQSPVHIYQKNGTYVVQLTVTNDNGDADTDTTSALIMTSRPPKKPELKGPSSGFINNEYTYIAVTTDPDQDNISYYFDWGDHTNTTTPFFPSGTVITAMHTWASPGSYAIQLCATDENNATSEIKEFLVLIKTPDDSRSVDGTTLENGASSLINSIPNSLDEQNAKNYSYAIMGSIFLPLIIIAAIILLYRKKQF